MTLDELKGFTGRVFQAEEATTFSEAVDLLVAFDAEEFTDTFELAIGQHYYGSESDAVDAVRRTMLDLTVNLVKLHGVTLIEDVWQFQVNAILRGLLDLPNWTDRDRINDILAQDIPDEDKFCELVCEITCVSVDVLIPLIEEVNPDLFDVLTETVKQEAAEDEQQADARKIESYRAFRQNTKAQELWSDRYLALKNIGIEAFPALLTLWLNENQNLLGADGRDVDYPHLAEELIGVAVISNVGLSGALQAINEHQPEIFRDIPRAMALNTAVGNKYLEISRG
jgi:hypothetical protein